MVSLGILHSRLQSHFQPSQVWKDSLHQDSIFVSDNKARLIAYHSMKSLFKPQPFSYLSTILIYSDNKYLIHLMDIQFTSNVYIILIPRAPSGGSPWHFDLDIQGDYYVCQDSIHHVAYHHLTVWHTLQTLTFYQSKSWCWAWHGAASNSKRYS